MLLGAQTLATATTTPAVWKQPDAAFQPATRPRRPSRRRVVDRLPAQAGDDVVLARSLGGLLAGLAAPRWTTSIDGPPRP